MPRAGVGPPCGLHGPPARAQLLLLARAEQQRVVDPGAEPEHAGERRGEPGHVGGGRRPDQRAEAQPEAGERRAERVARGPQAAQHRQQQHDRDRQPDQLTDGEAARGGAVDHLAGERDGHPRARQARRRGFEIGTRRRVQLLRGPVERDGGEGRAAVGRQPSGHGEGILDARHVWPAADVAECRPHGTLRRGPRERAVAGGEHDHRVGARPRGEAFLQQVLGVLGLDARHREVVLERAAGRDAAGDDGQHGEQDGGGCDPRAATDGRGDGGEQGSHTGTVTRLSRKINGENN